MSTVELRRETKRRIEQLSPERLQVAADFVAYLAERESNEATEELLRIPGLTKALEEAERGIAAGRVTRVEGLRRKQ
jgi:hypothetical protein